MLDLILLPRTIYPPARVSYSSRRQSIIYHGCSVKPCDASDHQLLVLELLATLHSAPQNLPVRTRKPPIRTINAQAFQTEITSKMSIVENQPTDLNANIELFKGSITEALDHHCPVRIVTFSTKYKPAPRVDDELRKLLYRRKRAHTVIDSC